MVPGSHRYPRSLGYVGSTTAESQRTWLEKVTGLDVTGSFKPSGGTGITVGMNPSTLLFMTLGAAVGYNNSTSKVKGVILGAGSAVAIITVAKFMNWLGV